MRTLLVGGFDTSWWLWLWLLGHVCWCAISRHRWAAGGRAGGRGGGVERGGGRSRLRTHARTQRCILHGTRASPGPARYILYYVCTSRSPLTAHRHEPWHFVCPGPSLQIAPRRPPRRSDPLIRRMGSGTAPIINHTTRRIQVLYAAVLAVRLRNCTEKIILE